MNWFSLAKPVILAWGWRRAAIAFVAGAASTLALAPVNAWPVMFATFPLLVWLLDGAAAARWGGVGAAFLTGWWFGFGYFLAGLYWVGYAFLVDAKGLNKVKGQPFTIHEVVDGIRAILEGRTGQYEVRLATQDVGDANIAGEPGGG